MCLPAALGAPALLTGATGSAVLSGAGLAMQAFGSYRQAQAAQAQANYNAAVAQNNAQVAEWQAQDAQRRGEEEAQAVRRNADQLKGRQRVTMAARGLDLTEGTAQELQDQTDFFGLTDVATTRNNAAREAWGRRVQGSNFQAEAGMNRATARQIRPGMAAASTLLSGAGQVADRWYSRG